MPRPPLVIPADTSLNYTPQHAFYALVIDELGFSCPLESKGFDSELAAMQYQERCVKPVLLLLASQVNAYCPHIHRVQQIDIADGRLYTLSLDAFIEQVYSGVRTRFAKVNGITYPTLQKWLRQRCTVSFDGVYWWLMTLR